MYEDENRIDRAFIVLYLSFYFWQPSISAEKKG